jgi:uncharacterized protein
MKRSILYAFILPIGVYAFIAWRASGKLIQRRKPDPAVKPEDYGLAYLPVRLRTLDGLSLGGWFFPARTPKAAVIFCHGHAGSMDPDIRYVPALLAAGYSVLMFDFRAHGRSEGKQVSMGALEGLDLLAAADYLTACGYLSIGVLGFSMGAATAMNSAWRHPAIRAIVSDGGFARLAPAVRGELERQRGLKWLSRPLTKSILLLAGLRLGCKLEEHDPIHWVSRLDGRALFLIHGERDPFVSLEDIRCLAEQAGTPPEIWIAPGASHRQVDKAYPAEYLPRIIRFFDTHLSPIPGS